jgi:hypothetical protein
VTEEPKPVGSGRFREQTRDAEAVPGLVLALLIQHLPTSVSLLCTEANSRPPCFSSGCTVFRHHHSGFLHLVTKRPATLPRAAPLIW